MFSPWTSPHVNFWITMTISGMILTTYSLWADRTCLKGIKIGWVDFLLGIGIAVALWGVFWIGDKVSSWMFDFARPQVNNIYGMKDGENPWILSLLLLFIIGPAEEIFWRGYLQNNLSKRFNPNMGFILTTLAYSLVHIFKFNFMLIMAAAVAGFIWGLLYRFFPNRLGAIVLSHALWDCAVFIWFPI
jgi:membrane protease YdiL (CAAX protease family)